MQVQNLVGNFFFLYKSPPPPNEIQNITLKLFEVILPTFILPATSLGFLELEHFCNKKYKN